MIAYRSYLVSAFIEAISLSTYLRMSKSLNGNVTATLFFAIKLELVKKG